MPKCVTQIWYWSNVEVWEDIGTYESYDKDDTLPDV